MYERFTERSPKVIELSQDAARGLGHQQIGPEHVLLGLLAERESAAAWTLRSLGLNLEDARTELVSIAPPTARPTAGRLDFSPHGQTLLEMARVESERRNAKSV